MGDGENGTVIWHYMGGKGKRAITVGGVRGGFRRGRRSVEVEDGLRKE